MNGWNVRSSWAVALLCGVMCVLLAAGRAAADTVTFGPPLTATPTFDTANGDYSISGGFAPAAGAAGKAILPSPHAGEDLGVWNGALASGTNTAVDGQVLSISVKGCAVEEPAPSQLSEGTPTNFIEFNALKPNGDGTFTVQNDAQGPAGSPYLLPFCSNQRGVGGTTNSSTITTYQPLHLCVNNGEIISLHNVGGFIPPDSTGNRYYVEGIPMLVLAQVPGSSIDSFVGVQTSTWGPGLFGPPDNTPAAQAVAGFGTVPNEELEIEVTEGTGIDAYGLCPGGRAAEPASANTVLCVSGNTNPGDKYGTCDGNFNPVFAPVNQSPPTISGTAASGSTLTVTHGSWTNSPTSFSEQWARCDSSGNNCSPIAGATKNTYKVTDADTGSTLVVQESATNKANTEGPINSAATGVVGGGGSGTTGTSGNTGSGTGTFSVGKLKLGKYTFKARKGTTITYNDSQAGTTVVTVTKQGQSKVVFTTSHVDTPGTNSIPFKPTKLRKGFYTLVLTSTFDGQSATNRHGFRIVSG